MNLVNLGQSSTHHGPNCRDYTYRDIIFLRGRPNQDNKFYIMSLIPFEYLDHCWAYPDPCPTVQDPDFGKSIIYFIYRYIVYAQFTICLEEIYVCLG